MAISERGRLKPCPRPNFQTAFAKKKPKQPSFPLRRESRLSVFRNIQRLL
ncbi:hypothetical protein NEIMUCOT_06265 [Neisseria mucosa ATCC 25996]|uniref:Uncharacterized protein n=1 Tax=Neisseria mucosa (strain ATCC 25996 / DSM 4631 / NCTC 10774 / M26) TaxID=546266 RepID=D3A030_NEIM2|nr:hypothetical protein NEIMUCOT_06265 [Neisseria mucosa ATCC 25996]